MRHCIRRAVALLTLGLVGLTGCHSLQGLTGYSSSASNGPGNPANSSAPASSDTVGAELKSRPLKQMHGTQAEKVETLLVAAQQMENSGKWAEAIGYYEQVRQIDPRKNLFCARHLAVLYDRKDDFTKALDEYAVLLKANPKDASAYNDRGYGYYRRGKFDAAEQHLRKAVEFDPKNTLAWSNLGMALAQLGRFDEALAAFEKSAQKNGNTLTRPQALCNIAFIQASQGKWIEARDSYALALKEEPGLDIAEIMLKRINEEMIAGKKRDRADNKRRVRDIERADRIDPEMAGGLPFGAPTGLVGGSARMIEAVHDDAPLHLPMQGHTRYVVPTQTEPAIPHVPVPQSAVQLPPIPTGLDVD